MLLVYLKKEITFSLWCLINYLYSTPCHLLFYVDMKKQKTLCIYNQLNNDGWFLSAWWIGRLMGERELQWACHLSGLCPPLLRCGSPQSSVLGLPICPGLTAYLTSSISWTLLTRTSLLFLLSWEAHLRWGDCCTCPPCARAHLAPCFWLFEARIEYFFVEEKLSHYRLSAFFMLVLSLSTENKSLFYFWSILKLQAEF